MSWTLLFTLASCVFINRYLFLDPKLNLKPPIWFDRMLQYSAPCLLTAMCVPIVFFEEMIPRQLPFNAYFMGTCICIFLALLSKKLLMNLALSLACFYLMIIYA